MATQITREELLPILPARPSTGHKGTFGHVLILAGSRGFTGAAKLAAEAAGRSGVGLVTVGVPGTVADCIAAALVEAMSLALPDTLQETFSTSAVAQALDATQTRDAVVLGPGISQHADTRRFVHEFIAGCTAPLVVDADGLNCIGPAPGALAAAKTRLVLTPHPGEMARLLNCSVEQVQRDREAAVKLLSTTCGCVTILKGNGTVVADAEGTCWLNPTGNSGLAKGGTGDVLAGLLGGLLAQRMEPCAAARLAVYLHGLAGDLAARDHTERGMVARDVIAAIPAAWRELERTR
ncbi:MAG: NAD(P)H-hydrate dehydratase [Candidatus Hydrogenedentes bacterium]|nr:NAD(P)H-hydrate dehydratase [Candidatus Hydrogenedentota bacterium]